MTLTYLQVYLNLETQCKYIKHMTFWVPCWHTHGPLLIWHHTWPPGSLVGTSTYGENSLIFHTHWIACQLRCTHCPHTSIWVTIRRTGFPALPAGSLQSHYHRNCTYLQWKVLNTWTTWGTCKWTALLLLDCVAGGVVDSGGFISGKKVSPSQSVYTSQWILYNCHKWKIITKL